MAKVPATLVTGFLGAGKTSLIRNLMLNKEGKRIALIINEFGETGVDGDLLQACGFEDCEEGEIQELSNGCLCCTVADDFVPTMEALLDRPNPPEHILIETSGLAMPKPLVKAFAWHEVRNRTTVDGVITLVDGPAVASGLFASDPAAVDAQRQADEALDHESPLEELFEEQILSADLVVITKTDVLDAPTLAQVRELVDKEKRPAARVIESTLAGLPPSVLLGLDAAAEDDLDSRPSHHDGADEHEHDDFDSFVLEIPEALSADAALEAAKSAAEAAGALRVKGFVAVKDKPRRLLIQGVGPRFDAYFDRAWGTDEPRRSRLVFIGEVGMDQEAARTRLLNVPAHA